VVERPWLFLYRHTWNWVVLVLVLLSLLLITSTIGSINRTSRSTGDRLSLTSARNTLQQGGLGRDRRRERAAAHSAATLGGLLCDE
jgi:hypothetical protein